MDFELTHDQELLAGTTRRFLEDRAGVDTVRALRDDPHGYDPAYWRDGCALGWTSLLVSEADGGGSVSDVPVEDLALLAHEFGSHASPGPLIATNVAASTLSRRGTDDQKAELLPGLLDGTAVAAWAFAEPPPARPLDATTTQATPDGSGWVLRGTKVAVESADTSTHLLVTATGPDGPTQLLVPTDAAGIVVEPMESVDLTRRFAKVTFDGVPLGADAVVGKAGGATTDVAHQLGLANALQAAEMVGALDAAMDITLAWVMDRYSFGRPLGSYQAIKHRLADMKVWLEASHALADAATHAVGTDADNGDELCSAAKAYIGHHGPELCQECVQLHGGIGVTFEHDLHLYLRRVVLDSTTYGTVHDHRLRLTEILATRQHEEAVVA